jgi:uroporphyrinogen-III synthase
MTSPTSRDNSQKLPVLLLKTKSTPNDAYEELFSRTQDGFEFEPIFVPVLQHRFEVAGMNTVRGLLRGRSFGREPAHGAYGGLIFTSQRAVEAFAQLAEEGTGRAYSN